MLHVTLVTFRFGKNLCCLPLRDVVKSLAARYAQGLKVGGNKRRGIRGFPRSLSCQATKARELALPAAQGEV